MTCDRATLCRNLVGDLWNREDHSLLKAVDRHYRLDEGPVRSARGGPLLWLALMNTYRGFVPDLTCEVEGQIQRDNHIVMYWSGVGHHWGRLMGIRPTGHSIRVRGTIVARSSRRGTMRLKTTNDIHSFMRQVGLGTSQLRRLLHPAIDDVAIRATIRTPGVPLLLFPTMSLPGWITWRRFIDVLQETAPVVTYQLLANRYALEGREPLESYCLRDENDALRRALERAGLDGPFDLVGHSAGGTLALDFALQHPSQVRSLTLIEPGAAWVLKSIGSLADDVSAEIAARMRSYEGELTPASYAAFLKKTYLAEVYEPTATPHWPSMCAYMNNMRFRPALYAHADDVRRLESATWPVLLIRGSDSDLLHRESVRELAARLPNAEVIELPGGHVPHYGAGMLPFVNTLRSFLGTLAKRVA